MKPREGISAVDPAQIPTDLKEPAVDAGQPSITHVAPRPGMFYCERCQAWFPAEEFRRHQT